MKRILFGFLLSAIASLTSQAQNAGAPEPLVAGQGGASVYDKNTGRYLMTVPEQLFDDGTVAAYTERSDVDFTFLPIVSMEGAFGYDYAEGTVSVLMPDGTDQTAMSAKVKWRGGSTNTAEKHKRNYHIKFIGSDGKKQDRKFFGLRNDNSWLLDAAQVDFSRVRNRAATDLWNDMATKPYYYNKEKKALTGTRGQFVELFLNGSYRGIYCMTEAMDRSQLKLKKYEDKVPAVIHGQLWKSGGFDNSFGWDDLEPYDNNSDTWGSVEMKYPDIDDVCPTDWSLYSDAVRFVHDLLLIDLFDPSEAEQHRSEAEQSMQNFCQRAPELFDLDVLADYVVLCHVLRAIDNHNGKNIYWACYDRQQSPMLTPAVWDMDCIVGGYYNPSRGVHPEDLVGPEAVPELSMKLLYVLDRFNVAGFHDRVNQRYQELRQTHLSQESLTRRFTDYMDMLTKAGAYTRDAAVWSGDSDLGGHALDYAAERQYICQWIEQRLKFLDRNLNYTWEQFVQHGLATVEVFTESGKMPVCEERVLDDGTVHGICNATQEVANVVVTSADGIAYYEAGKFQKGESGATIQIADHASAINHLRQGLDGQYQLQLEREADLLQGSDDSHADTRWQLINAGTTLYTQLGRDLSDQLQMPYTPRYMPCNLFINGLYQGLYLLSETVSQNSQCRVGVDEKSGFIVERTISTVGADQSFGTLWTGDGTDSQYHWTCVYPDTNDLTDERLTTIVQTISQAEASLCDGTYPQHYDIQSFASWMLAHDILGSDFADGNGLYMAKHDSSDDSKLFMPSLWDFSSVLTAPAESFARMHQSKSFYFPTLFSSPNSAFADAYCQRWQTLRETLLSDISDFYNRHIEGEALEWSRWKHYDYFHHDEDGYKSIEGEKLRVMQYMERHLQWLDDQVAQMQSGIETVTPPNSRATTYSLTGQRMGAHATGVVIRNGKKVILSE